MVKPVYASVYARSLGNMTFVTFDRLSESRTWLTGKSQGHGRGKHDKIAGPNRSLSEDDNSHVRERESSQTPAQMNFGHELPFRTGIDHALSVTTGEGREDGSLCVSSYYDIIDCSLQHKREQSCETWCST